MEAVTANPTVVDGVALDVPEGMNVLEYQRHGHAIKLASALYSKLQRRYWDLPHVNGIPLILAIEDFHTANSLHYSDASLRQYLYGHGATWYTDAEGELHIDPVPINEHRAGTKVIPSGFFGLPDADYVSAVLFSNSGTIPKFNRMGWLAGFGREAKVTMMRRGLCYDHTPNSSLPAQFFYELGEEDAPTETWRQGLSLFHNRRARFPLPRDFMGLAHHWLDGERLRSRLPDFHPFASLTVILTPKPSGSDGGLPKEGV